MIYYICNLYIYIIYDILYYYMIYYILYTIYYIIYGVAPSYEVLTQA